MLPDVAGFTFVTRGKDYHLLDHPLIQARLHLPPDQSQQRPESQMVRSLYDCPQIPVGPDGVSCRVIVATHPAGNGNATIKPRRISVLLHPLQVGSAPLLWRDWSRREHRRACLHLVRHQRVEVSMPPPVVVSLPPADAILSRAQRAQARLSWEMRLGRNARRTATGHVTIRLFGIPEEFASCLGMAQVYNLELAHENGAREEHASAEMRSVSGNILLHSEPSRSGENTAQFCAESRDLIAHDGLH